MATKVKFTPCGYLHNNGLYVILLFRVLNVLQPKRKNKKQVRKTLKI